MTVYFITFLLIVSSTIGHPPEVRENPDVICSKYHYDEQLLEKMIRMEFKMDQMIQDAKDKEKDVSNLAADFSQKVNDIEDSVTQFQRSVNKTMEGLSIPFADKSSLPVIAFNVRLSSTMTVKRRQKIVYDTEITNYGEGYDKSTGIFIAPYTGLYFFSANVCNKGNYVVQYSIIHEGTYLTTSTQYDNNGVYSCSSVSIVVLVNKAEKVWVQCLYESVLYTDSARWNTFTGTLIYKQT